MSTDVCLDCGACCREAFHAVELSRRDRFARRHPELLVVAGGRLGIRRVPVAGSTEERPLTRCVCLGEDYRCAHYADRPVTCRDFELSSENCDEARRRVGLLPLSTSTLSCRPPGRDPA
ncbi:MAG: YkgJ family cysteine cluster protein [Deltaproteobacteria bacterium]|nr:YkgJ family cysteine cluster protein [Deltaproteobacteria bacterium]